MRLDQAEGGGGWENSGSGNEGGRERSRARERKTDKKRAKDREEESTRACKTKREAICQFRSGVCYGVATVSRIDKMTGLF